MDRWTLGTLRLAQRIQARRHVNVFAVHQNLIVVLIDQSYPARRRQLFPLHCSFVILDGISIDMYSSHAIVSCY